MTHRYTGLPRSSGKRGILDRLKEIEEKGKDATQKEKEMVVALEILGSDCIFYEELQGYGHNVWGYAGDKPEIWFWFFEQTREGR
jgi:hypothetical protein